MDHLKFSTKGLQTEKFEIPFFVKSMMSPRSREKMLGTRNKQNQIKVGFLEDQDQQKARRQNKLQTVSRRIKMAYVMLLSQHNSLSRCGRQLKQVSLTFKASCLLVGSGVKRRKLE